MVLAWSITFVSLLSVHAWATYPGENGRIVFVGNFTGTWQLFTINPDGNDLFQVTNLPQTDLFPSDWFPDFSPDGQRVVFTSDRAGYLELYWRPGDGTGSDERLLTRAKDLIDLRAENWSPDGKQLLLVEVSSSAPRVECVIEEMPVERPSTVKILVKNDFCNDHPAISPDGHWMAYQSSLSGRNEIYTERYPELATANRFPPRVAAIRSGQATATSCSSRRRTFGMSSRFLCNPPGASFSVVPTIYSTSSPHRRVVVAIGRSTSLRTADF